MLRVTPWSKRRWTCRAVVLTKAERFHLRLAIRRDKPPRQVPGRVVIDTRIAPPLPSQHWCQCRHHQEGLAPVVRPFQFFDKRKHSLILCYDYDKVLPTCVPAPAALVYNLNSKSKKPLAGVASVLKLP